MIRMKQNYHAPKMGATAKAALFVAFNAKPNINPHVLFVRGGIQFEVQHPSHKASNSLTPRLASIPLTALAYTWLACGSSFSTAASVLFALGIPGI